MGEKVLRLCLENWKCPAGSVCLRPQHLEHQGSALNAAVGNICASQAAHKPEQGKFPIVLSFPKLAKIRSQSSLMALC